MDFNLEITKNMAGEALETPVTITYNATLDATNFNIAIENADGTTKNITTVSLASHPDLTTVQEGIDWFADCTANFR